MMPKRGYYPLILMIVFMLDIFAAVWGWGNWQVWVTVTVLALVLEVALMKRREARDRRRFRKATDELINTLLKQGNKNVTPIRPPDDVA
jgi:Flp pilus assembly protein TadB